MSSTAQSRERRGFLSSASRFAGDTPTALPVNNLRRTRTDELSIRFRQREVQTSRSRSSSRQSIEDEKLNNESKESIERSNIPQAKDYYGTLNNQNRRTVEHSSIDRGRLQTLSSRSTPSSIRRIEPRRATSISRRSALPLSSRRLIHQSGSIGNVEIADEDELWGDIAALTSKLARMQREGASVETVRKAASEMVAARIKKNEGLRLQESGSKTKEFDVSNGKSAEWSANKTNFVSSQPDHSSSKKSYNTTSQKNTSRKTLNPSASQTISFIDVDDVVDRPVDFADESSFSDGDDDEEDAESEESNAGDKGMQAAVAELTRMEVQKQMKMMFQSGELGTLKVNNSETPLISLPSSAEKGSQSPFPFSPVPLQVGATLTADFGEFHHQKQFDTQITSDSSSFNKIDDDDDDESSGLSSENDDEEADHAAKVVAKKAMVLANPASPSLSEGQKRMLAMTLGIDRAKMMSPFHTTPSFDTNNVPQNDTRDLNHELKRNRRAVIASPQSVDDETEDEQALSSSPTDSSKHGRSTQPVASQRVKSLKRETITSSLPSTSSSSPSLKSVVFSVSPLRTSPLPHPGPPPLPPTYKTPPPDSFIDDSKLLKEEVKTLRALLERVAGQLEEQKERQKNQEKIPVNVSEAVDQKVPIEKIEATPRSRIPLHLNNQNISTSSMTSPTEKKSSSAALTSSSSLSSPSSKTSSLSTPPSSLLNTAPPPKACAPSLPDIHGPVYSVIADFFGDPSDGQINSSIGDLLVCPNDEEHRPIEAVSNGWWFAYKLIPSTGHLSNLQAPPQLDKHTDKLSLSTVKGYVPFAYLNSTGKIFSRASVIKSSSSMASEIAKISPKVSLPPQLSSPAVSSPHVHGPLTESRLTAHKAAAARARIQLSLPFSTRDDNNTSITNSLTGKVRDHLSTVNESHPSFTSPTSPDINPMWNAKSGAQSGSLPKSQPSALQNIERSHFATTSNQLLSTSSTLFQKSSSDYSDWNSLKAAYEQLKLSAKKLDVTSEFGKSLNYTTSHNVTSGVPTATLPTATSHPLELNRDLGFGALSSALVTLMKPTSSSTSVQQNVHQTHTQNSNEKTYSSSKTSTRESQENAEFISYGRITEPDHDAALLGSIASSFRASSTHPGNKLLSILSIEKKVDVDEKQTSTLSMQIPPLRLSSPSILSIPPPQVAFSPPILENEPPYHRASLSVKGRETRLTDLSQADRVKEGGHSENVLRSDVMRSDSLSLTSPPHSMSSLSKKPFLELSSNPAPALDVPGSRRGDDRLKPRRKDVNAPAVDSSVASFSLEPEVMSSSSQVLTVVPESKSLVTLRDDSDDHLISMMNLSSFSHRKEKSFSLKSEDRNGDNSRITSPVSPFYSPPAHLDELVNLEENYEQQQVNPPDSSIMTNNNVISPLKLGGPLPGSVVLKGMPFSKVIPQKNQSSRSTPPNLAATNTLKSAIRAASTSSPSKIHPSSEDWNIFHDKQISASSPKMLENIARAKEMKQIRQMRQRDSSVISSSSHPLQQTSSFKRATVPSGLIDDNQEEKLNESHFKEGEEDDNDVGDDETEDYMESVDLEEEIKLRKTYVGDTEDYISGQHLEDFEKEDNYSSRVSRESSKKITTHSFNSLTPLETKSEEWDSSPPNKIKGPTEQQHQQLENASPGESRLGTVAAWLGLKSRTGQRGNGNDAITDDGARPSDTISKTWKDVSQTSRMTSPLVQVTTSVAQKSIVVEPRENSSVAAGVGLITPIGQEGLGRSSSSKTPSSVFHVSSLLPKFVTTKEGLINLAPPQQQLQQLAVRGADEVSNHSKNPAVIEKRPVILMSSLPHTQSNGFQPSMVETSERDENFGSVLGSDSSTLVYSASSALQRPESIRVTSGAPPHLRGLRASASSTVNSSGSSKRVRTFS
jgi:hypothetical protein